MKGRNKQQGSFKFQNYDFTFEPCSENEPHFQAMKNRNEISSSTNFRIQP